jgi:Fe-S-cluster-containing hydrogenase component 2
MNTGPKATGGFDLALTEVLGDGTHFFMVEAGSERGSEALKELPHREAKQEEMGAAERTVAETSQHMGRSMDIAGIKELLYRNYEHPRWDEVASRCLTCANCTMVCPTCFCTTVKDVTDLTGEHAERWRKWDSCFTMDFSCIHGGSVRASTKSRYRQWMTHKLATWIDQFGTSGCVGCGRCITWCPVAIDLTEEVRAIRQTDSGGGPARPRKERPHANHT